MSLPLVETRDDLKPSIPVPEGFPFPPPQWSAEMWKWPEDIKSVPELWTVWHQGRTSKDASVMFLNAVYGSRWRRSSSERQHYCSRSVIIAEISAWAARSAGENAGYEELRQAEHDACLHLEKIRKGYSLTMLSRALRREMAAGVEPGRVIERGTLIIKGPRQLSAKPSTADRSSLGPQDEGTPTESAGKDSPAGEVDKDAAAGAPQSKEQTPRVPTPPPAGADG